MGAPVLTVIGMPGEGAGRVGKMWCPGCHLIHQVLLDGPQRWEWDGNAESPTISPSILVQGGSEDMRCHSFVRAGRWEFLDDCTHTLAGQTVPMGPIPDEVRAGTWWDGRE